jgi:hypothetical protein
LRRQAPHSSDYQELQNNERPKAARNDCGCGAENCLAETASTILTNGEPDESRTEKN